MLFAAIAAIIVPLRAARVEGSRLYIAVSILVPAIAVGFYATLGSPDAASRRIEHRYQSQAATRPAFADQSKKSAGSVSSLIDGLRARLEKEPEDAGGWLLLAKSYKHLGQTDDANFAYEHARALGKIDAEFEHSIGATASESSIPVDAGPALRGRVTLTANAAALVRPSDIVFIFAKESIEQRMPIVALRRPATEFPMQFSLTDRDAMVAGISLADFDHLVVTAKISRSGLATEVLAGLEVWSGLISPNDKQLIELQIGKGIVGNGDE